MAPGRPRKPSARRRARTRRAPAQGARSALSRTGLGRRAPCASDPAQPARRRARQGGGRAQARLGARRSAPRARRDPFPDYPQWVGDPALAALWRDRARRHPSLEPASKTGPATRKATAYDIRNYEGRAVGGWVLYATREQHARGAVAFVDRGKRITLHDRDDAEAASLAAMQLAAAKWGPLPRARQRGAPAPLRAPGRRARFRAHQSGASAPHRATPSRDCRTRPGRGGVHGLEAATLARTFRQMARQHRGLNSCATRRT